MYARRIGTRAPASTAASARLISTYHVRGTVGDVKNRYSFTSDGLHNLAVYGVEPGEVWQILRASRRITRQMSEDANAVLGVTDEGRSLVASVAETNTHAQHYALPL